MNIITPILGLSSISIQWYAYAMKVSEAFLKPTYICRSDSGIPDSLSFYGTVNRGGLS